MGTRGGSLWGRAAARPHLSAALLLAAPVLVYLWPVLVGGELLAPLSILYGLPPWSSVAPDDLAGYFNFTLVDVGLAVYPWREHARELIHDGVLPAWNAQVFAGVPFWSNPQNGLFSPFNLPLWILPLDYGLGLSAALKLWAGAFGTYLLVRQLGLAFMPGLLAGVAFAFSSLNIVWLTHETLPAVAVMLPWMAWFVERIFERGRPGDAIGLAVATAIAVGGGHPGMQLHAVAAAGLYAALRAGFTADLTRSQRLRPLALAGGGLTLGVLLMGAMLVPELLSSRDTIGTSARQGGTGTLPGTTMPIDAIKTVLFPDWWGRPSAVELEQGMRPPGLVNFNERTFYAGAVALLLAVVGLVSAGGWRRKAPFAVLGALGLAIPLHAPGLWWLVTHLPAFELVQNQRLHFVFAFAVAVLSAFGLQAVLDRPTEERHRLAVPLGAVLLGLLAFALVDLGDVGSVVDHFLSGDDVVAGALAQTSIVWFLLFATATGAALLVARRWPGRVAVCAAALVLLATLDALHFSHGYQPMAPAAKMIPPRTPAIDYLVARADEGRITGIQNTLINDWSSTYGLSDIRGYDPPFPTQRYYRLWLAATPEQLDWQPFNMTALDPSTVKVAGALGARYAVAPPDTESPPRDDPALRSVERVYDGEDATIFRLSGAAPRVLVASRVLLAEDEGQARGTLLSEDFDVRETAVVEQGEPGAAALAAAAPVRGTVRIEEEANARVTLSADLEQRGLVVLNDHFTAGWSVRVDGEERPAVRVNDVMRGVVVPAGRHEVEWSYRVPGLRLGLLLSVLSAVTLIAGGIAVRRRTPSR